MKKISVSAKVNNDGFSILLNMQKYNHCYPFKIWQNYPNLLKLPLAETAAYFFTHNLPAFQKVKLDYRFPPPAAYSLYVHGLVYSLLEVSCYKKSTVSALKKSFNSSFSLSFTGVPHCYPQIKIDDPDKKKAVILFTFGKDSLLTLALTEELGLKSELFFMDEPQSPYELQARDKFKGEFSRQFKTKLNIINLEVGNLRQFGGQMWGWDLIIMEYLLLLLPFIRYSRAAYFFISNEHNNDEIETDKEGFLTYYRYEQSSQWTLNLNHLLRLFASKAHASSLIEPLYEFLAVYILHHRYPAFARYHLSCCGDDEKSAVKRWCGVCFACTRMYLFLLSFGIDPEFVGFHENLLKKDKSKYYGNLFEKNRISDWPQFLNSNAEILLAFYLAYLRGNNGELMIIFRKKYLFRVEKNIKLLMGKVLRLYSTESVPGELKNRLLPIYKSELENLKKEIRLLSAVHAGKY
ncbi:hypothetical protein A2153_01245 [Candidatus Gottesmanbacteria bacterium RBG_16_38_7b]|uniref:UDP-N-acetyl-alpha-D-muramoyl-L-alanyl-L-glutamate epimerase n=1 Tax=Candidatus Gottesmanbacteria bacterium RBG_16_38_7b TaxID=1798372 RepID=A0A1F5YFW1_9BACT|nr:MAG: hypothetical protein A2153_01245 [Candidatus Gottesmanbacteria bacterium RBG_16_38_7b]